MNHSLVITWKARIRFSLAEWLSGSGLLGAKLLNPVHYDARREIKEIKSF